ncbi:MAG: hypothetical protein ACREM3_29215 [Candidatus Rokuibacteriota bacterium]
MEDGLPARPQRAPFFEPATVAVVGASRDPAKVGGSVLANLTAAGFAGRVVPALGGMGRHAGPHLTEDRWQRARNSG